MFFNGNIRQNKVKVKKSLVLCFVCLLHQAFMANILLLEYYNQSIN